MANSLFRKKSIAQIQADAAQGFADAEELRPRRFNNYEIARILRTRSSEFEDANKNDDADKNKARTAWKNVFCDITNGKKTFGMSPEMISVATEYCISGITSVPPLKIPAPVARGGAAP